MFVVIGFPRQQVVANNIVNTRYTAIIHLSLSCNTRF